MENDSKTIISLDQPVTMGQLMQLFSQFNPTKTPKESETNNQPISLPEKLTHQNYTTWSRLMQLALKSCDRLSHITAEPPSPDEQEYNQWTRHDSMVISWILGNIDRDLVNQFLDFSTAKSLWKGIETLYSSGRDGLQIFDLTVKTNKIKQGNDSIENYYSKLIGLWKEIDRRQPNPMKDPEDITTYNELVQENRLYQFLVGVDETYDKDRRDILIQNPLPTVEEAYAIIRRETMRRGIMRPTTDPEPSSLGGGFIAKSRTYRKEYDKSHLKCTHCGGTRHTKSDYFKLVGYPEWWSDSKKKGTKEAHGFSDHKTGRAAMGMSFNEQCSR